MLVTHPRSVMVAIALMVTLTACKKTSNTNSGTGSSDFYVKFTLDGTEMTYINNAEGNANVLSGGRYTFSGAALKASNIAATNNLSLIISNTNQIKTNTTYVNYTTSATGFERTVLESVAYIDASGIVFNSWGDEYASSGVISDSKINFSEITTTNLRGTFSGTSYKSISGTAEKHVITKGEFNLKRR